MQCELLKTHIVKPSRKSDFDAIARATADWQRRHVDDNARIAEGVVLSTGTIKPRLTLLDALNAKAKAWHEHWDTQIANRNLAFAGA
ncbi:MAG: hypothetical protein Q7K44_03460 [Candidatus Liptonbacteria bacterium]|nr:hypothetical protein [Candidatus Liptonbacteria bacterium]